MDPRARPDHRSHHEAEAARLRAAYDIVEPSGGAEPATGESIVAAVLALVGPLFVWGGGVWLASTGVGDELPAGQCHGIGFGCTLGPGEGVAFYGAALGLVVVPVATVVAFLAAAAGRRRNPVGAVVAVLVLVAVGVAVFAAAMLGSPPNT